MRDETYYRVRWQTCRKREARLNLGAEYWNLMRPADAEPEWKLALAYAPDNALLLKTLASRAPARSKIRRRWPILSARCACARITPTRHLNLGRLDVQMGHGRG